MLQKRATCQFNYKRVTNVERIAGHVLIDAKVEQLFKMYQHVLHLLRNQLSGTVANTSNGNMGLSTRSILVPIISHSYYCTILLLWTQGQRIGKVNNLSIDHTQIQMWRCGNCATCLLNCLLIFLQRRGLWDIELVIDSRQIRADQTLSFINSSVIIWNWGFVWSSPSIADHWHTGKGSWCDICMSNWLLILTGEEEEGEGT